MDVRLPKLGEGADSGAVVSVMVKPGDLVQAGQILLELENEKAVASIPAPAAGRVAKVYVQVGQKLAVGQLIVSLQTEDKAQPKPASPAAPLATASGLGADIAPGMPMAIQPGEIETPAPVTGQEPAAHEEQPVVGKEGRLKEVTAAKPGFAPPASPTIRKLARELGLDLTRVRGSERGGRIVMQDVRAYIQRLQEMAYPLKAAAATPAPPAPAPVDFSQWGPIAKKPMTSIRRTISRRMFGSWSTIPHVTQFDEADITALLELRKKHGMAYEVRGARLTVTPFILKAAAWILKQFPIFNSSLDESTGEIILKEYYHIGLAVDTEAGLIVPVIRNVDQKGMLELAQELQALAERTRARKIAPEELKGGTFTISNQGGIGGSHFTPIINQPEVAVLGVGRSVLKPVVKAQQIVPRMVLPLCLSYDHRVIDGADAARFITQLTQTLESFNEAEVEIDIVV